MYKIIGADQKEYGPVTIDQIRQWIRDGRVNAQTQARLDPGGQWQPLSAFPEFADAFGVGAPTAPGTAPAPTPFAVGGGSRETALSAMKAPAIALIVTAAIGVALYCVRGLFMLVNGGAMYQGQLPPNLPPEVMHILQQMQGPIGAAVSLALAALNGFVLFGAIKMLRLQSRGLATAACIVAMLPCSCCCLLGLPFGIWGLVVLNKPDVKSHFT
jgi:hypothetical protein